MERWNHARSAAPPNPSSHALGLEGKEISSPSGRGRKMSLTSPLIDRDLTTTGRAVIAHNVENDGAIAANPSAVRSCSGPGRLHFTTQCTDNGLESRTDEHDPCQSFTEDRSAVCHF